MHACIYEHDHTHVNENEVPISMYPELQQTENVNPHKKKRSIYCPIIITLIIMILGLHVLVYGNQLSTRKEEKKRQYYWFPVAKRRNKSFEYNSMPKHNYMYTPIRLHVDDTTPQPTSKSTDFSVKWKVEQQLQT